MIFILFGLLAFISIGSFIEGKEVERRGLKLMLSLLLGFMLTVMIEGSMAGLAAADKIQGMPLYILFHTVIPTVVFFIFQLLFYNIKIFSE